MFGIKNSGSSALGRFKGFPSKPEPRAKMKNMRIVTFDAFTERIVFTESETKFQKTFVIC